MSNEIDIDPGFDMKTIDTAATMPVIKPIIKKSTIPLEEIPEELRGKSLTVENIDELATLISKRIDPLKNVQIVEKRAVPISDFSKLTQADIYNPDIFIEAKSFIDSNPLNVVLKDTNYEPHWAFKNSQRMGRLKTMGYTYVSVDELENPLELDIQPDANGQLSFYDVVLMKILKSVYYPMLRKNHVNATARVNKSDQFERGKARAREYMINEAGINPEENQLKFFDTTKE